MNKILFCFIAILLIWSGGVIADSPLAPDNTIYSAKGCGSCPPDGIDESEPNEGCDADPPAFNTIECGQTICGSGWYDGSARDKD